MLNVNNFNFIILNFLVIWTTWKSYHGELGLQWENLGRRHLTYIIDVISPTLIKTSTSIPELSSCQAQQACHFSRYKRSVYLREKKNDYSRLVPQMKRNQELLNWVLPTTESMSPNFWDTRNEEASLWYPKGEQHSPAEHHILADVDYKFFHHVGDCYCTRLPKIKLAPQSMKYNKLARKNCSVPQGPATKGGEEAEDPD